MYPDEYDSQMCKKSNDMDGNRKRQRACTFGGKKVGQRIRRELKLWEEYILHFRHNEKFLYIVNNYWPVNPRGPRM